MGFEPSLRPEDHFTPRRGWLNDPNGLITHEGEHHLFFQHRPDSVDPGPVSWGHAVSTDLLDWAELPVALAHTETGHMWSGSVVHDATNTSGLGPGGSGPLVALYTSFEPLTGRQSQHLAHSTDGGRTWTQHGGNPVLDIGSTAFRDPKVLRRQDEWLMVLVLAEDRTVECYRSADLLSWVHAWSFGPQGSVAGVWECPDLVSVPIEGTDQSADVLLVSVQDGAPAGGSGMQYFVGRLTGHGFEATQTARWVDHGADFYAAISYAGDVGPEPLVQAWMSNWQYAHVVPAADFRGSMSLPRRLTLRPRDGELVLAQLPVVRPRQAAYELHEKDVEGVLPLPVAARTCRITVELDPGSSRSCGLHVRVGDGERTTIHLDAEGRRVVLDRTRSGDAIEHPGFHAAHAATTAGREGPFRLEVVVDVASVELFLDHGEVVLTDQVFPSPDSTAIEVFADGGTARVRRLTVHA